MRNKYTHQHLQQEEEEEDHDQKHHRQRSKFRPTLCSSSTKQVIKHSVSHRRCSSTFTSTSSSPSSTVSEDPLSPRVGCMGQVKRNNKVGGFPSRTSVGGFGSTTTATGSCTKTTVKSHDHINNYSSNSIVKHHKFKRFFSTTSPTTTFATTAVARSGTQTHKAGKSAGRITSTRNSNNGGILRDDHGTVSRSKIDKNCAGAIATDYKKKSKYENDKGSFVNLMDLDPPLPVVKQEQKQGNDGENLSLWKRRSRGAPLKSLQVQVTLAHQQNCNLLLQPTTV